MLYLKASGFILFLLLLSSASQATIIVEDKICVVGEEIMLSAETRKGPFKKGGVSVEFFVNEKSIGKGLSGGDGIAYKAYTFRDTGLFKISVKTFTEKAEGLLLCLQKGQSIVLVDLETLKENPFTTIPKKESLSSLKRLRRRFQLVYLYSGLLSKKDLKEWLNKNGFPIAPLLRFKGDIFSEIQEMELKIRAVIAGPSIAGEAVSYKIRTLSFEGVEGAIEVDSWKEVEKKI